jgi:Domain of unknown function (DUF4251)
MKTMRFYLVCFFLTLGFFGISENSNSQSKKEVKKMQATQNFFVLDSLLKTRRFVFKVDLKMGTYSSIDYGAVNSTINFIEVDVDKGVMQVGYNSVNSVMEGMPGNGIGGFTAKGDILSWNLSQDTKKLNHILKFNLSTMAFNYDINLTVTSDNHVTALIQGGRVIWIGHLEAIDESGIYKGRSI